MYDKATRNLIYNTGSTPNHVGPGTYDVNNFQISERAENYAPFLSLVARQSHFTSDSLIAPPGPGHYDLYQPDDTIKGVGAMQPKAKRFFSSLSETPGPGAYNVRSTRDRQRSKSAADSAQQVSKRATSRLKFNRKIEAPSIPIPGKCYGYEECEDGTLRRQEAPDRDTTLGPAFYTPSSGLARGTKLYKGCHFGNYSGQRLTFSQNDVPGPGEYDVGCQSQWKVENANVGDVEKGKFECYVPRYLDAVVHNEKKWSVPGPAHYIIKRQFDNELKPKADQVEMDHPPFLSQSKRFQESVCDNPAPGTYNDPRTSLQFSKRISGLKQSPFGQTAVRFQNDIQRKKEPGPGSYNFQGMSSELIKKAYMESTRRGAFGSTAARDIVFTNRGQTEVPGPSHYQVKDKRFENAHRNFTSSFASTTRREKAQTPENKPGPDAYDVMKSFKRSQLNLERAKPRTDSAFRKQTAFMSAASRFAPMRDLINEQKSADEIPGPGTYEAKLEEQRKYGPMIGKSKRFLQSENDVPGPGAYEFSPLVTDTLMKGTFNVTLSKPMVSSSEG